MTLPELLEYARLTAEALPGATHVVHDPTSGREVLAWHGHVPVVVEPPGPKGLYSALHEAHRRNHPSAGAEWGES